MSQDKGQTQNCPKGGSQRGLSLRFLWVFFFWGGGGGGGKEEDNFGYTLCIWVPWGGGTELLEWSSEIS